MADLDIDPVMVPDWSAAARVEGESDEHHRWLRLYLALGARDRTLANVARILNKHETTVRKVSSRRAWRQRAARWDWEQEQLKGLSLREQVTAGMDRLASAAGSVTAAFDEHFEDPEAAIENPAKTATAVKSMAGAWRDMGEYASDLEARTPPDPDLVELAVTDPHEAARSVLARFMVNGNARPAERIGAARGVLAEGSEKEQEDDMLTVAGEILQEFPPELQRALAARLAQAGDR